MKRESYNLTATQEAGFTGLLTREQDRRLRAAAWRHIRRINSRIARRIWIARKHREQQRLAA